MVKKGKNKALFNIIRIKDYFFVGDDTQNGFTLIELLVSIFIFAIVMSMVYGAFRTVISCAETVKYGDLPYEQGRSAMERVSMDLDSLYVSHEAEYNLLKKEGKPDPYQIKLERTSYSGKSFSSLRFVSSAHASFGGEGPGVLSEIRFYVAKGQGDSFELRRSDKRFFGNGDGNERSPRDPVLCRNVTRFEVQAMDQGGMGHDDWDSETGSGRGDVPAFFFILLETGTKEGTAVFKLSASSGMGRMKNMAVPDDTGGTAVKGSSQGQETGK